LGKSTLSPSRLVEEPMSRPKPETSPSRARSSRHRATRRGPSCFRRPRPRVVAHRNPALPRSGAGPHRASTPRSHVWWRSSQDCPVVSGRSRTTRSPLAARRADRHHGLCDIRLTSARPARARSALTAGAEVRPSPRVEIVCIWRTHRGRVVAALIRGAPASRGLRLRLTRHGVAAAQ
jgi:hypothetical protein